jgi:hypothetical protein
MGGGAAACSGVSVPLAFHPDAPAIKYPFCFTITQGDFAASETQMSSCSLHTKMQRFA